MQLLEHASRMSAYNAWMNASVYDAAARLSEDDLARDRGAFFGSILGTLSHLVIADTIWLKRFAEHPSRHAALDPIRERPMPKTLDEMPFREFAALHAHREDLDALIERWVATLSNDDLDQVLRYQNTRGVSFAHGFFPLLMHFFNHQTHHRGQVTTLLTQAGVDVGVTDLLALIPDTATRETQHPHPH